MKDEFNHILNKFISEMPEHTPKPDIWQTIDAKLDEEIATSRLREILKNSEHAPNKKLWKNIENELDRTSGRTSFYFKTSFILLLSSFIITGSLITYFFLQKVSTNTTDKFSQRKNEIPAYHQSKISDQNNVKKQEISSEINKNTIITSNQIVEKNQSVYINNINNSENNPSYNSKYSRKSNTQKQTIVPPVTLDNYLNKNESKKKLNDSNQTKIYIEKEEYSIYGEIKWNMIKSENVSLYVYNEEGKFVTSIFENRNFETGKQSYDFKVHNCHIDKDKKYIVRLIINNEIKNAMECVAK